MEFWDGVYLIMKIALPLFIFIMIVKIAENKRDN